MISRRKTLAALAGAAVVAQSKKLPLMDEAGFQKLLASSKGKVLLVNFWATWCVPCREEMPALAKLEAKLRAKGLTLVTISADEPEDDATAQAFLKKSGITVPSYLKQAKNDEKFISGIEAKWSGALPALFLYDKTGKKAQSFVGETDLKVLEAAITKLL
ncbi:MAG: TlpA disulfide reductase family protein [Acidobacteria bacterium]|nr:TlpA disulfide reductase family protein [Acidobacteriota bacterium]